MLANSFIDYLLEQRVVDKNDNLLYFLLPKKVNDSGQVNEIIDCLKTCLEKLKGDPKDFEISARDINKETIAHILKIKDADSFKCADAKIKTQMIDHILKLPLKASFKKSEVSKSRSSKHAGWVFLFIIKDQFDPNFTVREYWDRNGDKTDPKNWKTVRKGAMLYLKFNFKSYEEAEPNSKGKITKIIIDPKSLKLDIISCHPTNSED